MAQSRFCKIQGRTEFWNQKCWKLKWNCLGWKNSLKSLSPLPRPPLITSKSHIHTDCKSHWGCRLHHCPCSMPEKPFGEEISPDIQPHPPLVQPEAVSSCWRKFLPRKLNPSFQDWRVSLLRVNSESRRIQDETAGFGSRCKLCCNLL